MAIVQGYDETGQVDRNGWPEWHLGCTWQPSKPLDSCVTSGEVLAIVEGRTRNDVTCPQCAVLLDIALELRGTS